jgi:hypothetical protein
MKFKVTVWYNGNVLIEAFCKTEYEAGYIAEMLDLDITNQDLSVEVTREDV